MRDPIRQAERLMAIRLRYTINSHLDDRGITTPAAVGVAIGVSAAEAAGLLRRRHWRAGDVTALQAVSGRLGLQVVPPDTDHPSTCRARPFCSSLSSPAAAAAPIPRA